VPGPLGRPSLNATLPERAFENRAARHAFACGQAAAASVLAQWRRGPFAHDWARASDTAAIDTLYTTHAPDMPFGLGTTVWRLVAALRTHGLDAECVHGEGAEAVLRARLAHGAWTPVLLDDGRLGGRPFAAHWAMAVGGDDSGVRLGNCRVARLDWPHFRTAWACWFLPAPHRRCAVVAHARTWLDPL